MRQYPIWNNVEACIYKSSKSYGVVVIKEALLPKGTRELQLINC